MADLKVVTLTGEDVLQISIDPNEQQTTGSTKSESRPYYRARYAGKVFIVDKNVYDDFKLGEIANITLAENRYFVVDPESTDDKATIERVGWTYSGHATYAQVMNIGKKKGEIQLGQKRMQVEEKKLDIELLVMEKKQLAEIKPLDAAAIKTLEDAI